jgi:hypothetical protein
MLSVALLALALLPILVGGMALIGSMLRWAISKVVRAGSAEVPGSWPALLIRVVEDVALGLSVIPVIYMIATFTNLVVGVDVAVALGLLAAIVYVARLLRSRAEFGAPIRGTLSRPGRVEWLLVGVLVVVAAVRLASYAPFLVYAGDDIRMFTLITQLVESHGHFVSSWGTFAAPSWNPVGQPHLRFAGSEAIFSVLNAWFPVNTPQLVSAAVIDFGILLPFAGFALFRALFPDRSYWVPALGALSLGLFSAYPLFYQDWGGIDEQVNWFLVPVALAFFLAYARSPHRAGRELWFGGLVLGGALIVNPYPLAYVGVFLVAMIAGAAAFRAGWFRMLGRSVAFYALGAAVAGPLLYQEITTIAHAEMVVPPGYAGWGVFQTAVILIRGDPLVSAQNLLLLHTGILGTALAVVVGWAGIFVAILLYRERQGVSLLGFALGLLVLNSNGPYGLFWVQYPGWDFLYADRPLEWLFLPLAGGAGWLLATLLENRPRPSTGTADPSRPPRRWKLPGTTGPGVPATSVIFVAALILGTASTVQIAIDNASTVAWGTELTPADVAAFSWMSDHLSRNSTTLVNDADAGTWISEFTGLRVFPYPELITSPTVYDQTQQITALFATTQYAPTLSFLAEYNISGAYWGARNGYAETPTYTPAEWVAPWPVVDFTTQIAICGATISIPLYLNCNGDTLTVAGPVVINIAEYESGFLAGTGYVSIPNGTAWTFTLQSGTSQYPGYWQVQLDEQPLGNWAYYASNAELAELVPAWAALETASGPVSYTITSGSLPQR